MCTPLHTYDRYCIDVPTACRLHLYRCQHADIVIHVWNLSLLCSNSQSFQSTLDIFIDCVIIIGFWCQYFGSVLLCRSVDVQVQCTTNALYLNVSSVECRHLHFFCVIFIQRIDHDKCCIYTYIPLSKCCCFSVIFIQHIDHDKCCIYTYIPFPKCCFSVMTAKLNICFHLVSEADPATLFDWLPKRRPTKKTNKDFCLPKITKVYIS